MQNFKVEKVEYKVSAKHRHLLPNRDRYKVSFKTKYLHIANAIRRVLLNELPVMTLYANYDDVVVNNYATTSDWIANRLKLIPITQDHKDLTGTLEYLNSTGENITVYTKDIKFKDAKNEDIMDCNIPIVVLEPDCYINVKISTRYCYGWEADGESTIACVDKWDTEDNTSVNVVMSTVGNFHGNDIIKVAVDNIIIRLNNILDSIKDIKQTTYLDNLHIIISDTNIMTIFGETDTIGNIIIEEMYKIDPSIPLVVGRHEHNLQRNYIIHWKHTSNITIVIKAINSCINILNEFI
jgi:hypothetical protein